MTTALGTTSVIDSALRKAFSDASVRVAPTTRMTDIIEALKAMGIGVEVQDGVLVLTQGTTSFNTSLALRNFSIRPEHARFFVLETSDPKTWTTAKKVEYLRTHSADEYAKLCRAPVIEAGIRVLDANMSRHDYENLTRAEKVQFLSEYGDEAARHILGVRAK